MATPSRINSSMTGDVIAERRQYLAGVAAHDERRQPVTASQSGEGDEVARGFECADERLVDGADPPPGGQFGIVEELEAERLG